MEQTPKLNIPPGQLDAPPDEPEVLSQALMASADSPSPNDTPGQLRRDLSRALLQATALESPSAGVGLSKPDDSKMGPPPLPSADNKNRKRKLEDHLQGNKTNIFDQPVDMGDEQLMLRDLLDQDSLDLQLQLSAKPVSIKNRKSSKEKEKGKPNRCRCDRSGCLKRYCVCFAAGNMCAGDCKCKGCNNDDTTEERKAARDQAVVEMQKKKSNAFVSRIAPSGETSEKVHISGCNCRKSGCRKRYCECFQAGVKCTDKCRCCECANPAGVNPMSAPLPEPKMPAANETQELITNIEGMATPDVQALHALAGDGSAMSPAGNLSSPSACVGLGSLPSLSQPSRLANSPFGGRSPFGAMMQSPAGSYLLAVAAAASAAEPSAEDSMLDETAGSKLFVDSFSAPAVTTMDAEPPSSPDDMPGPSVEMLPSPESGLLMPQAKAALAADTPEPRVGSAPPHVDVFIRDVPCSTPSPPALASTAPSLGCVPGVHA